MLSALGCSTEPGSAPPEAGTGSDASDAGLDRDDASIDADVAEDVSSDVPSDAHGEPDAPNAADALDAVAMDGDAGNPDGGGGADATDADATPDGPPTDWVLSRGGFIVRIARTGAIADVRDADGRTWDRGSGGENLIRVGVGAGELLPCDSPKSVTSGAGELSFDYDLRPDAPLLVRSTIALVDAADGVAIKRSLEITPTAPPLQSLVKVSVGDNLGVPGTEPAIFVPHHDGYGEQAAMPTATRRLLFVLSGGTLDGERADRLAIPMVSESDKEGDRLTRVADVMFSSSLALGGAPSTANRITWVYLSDRVPIVSPESRVLFHVLHHGPAEAAMNAFYATAVADVPPGPAWLHDITWQHYDYLSHGGRGWFADIDALAAAIPQGDRSGVLLTLHGWFDVYGRYALDPVTHRLVESWNAFPNAPNVKDQFPGAETVAMTKAELHRRIAYGKSRGFRVALYFADGTASGEDVDGLWRMDRVLRKGGWQGPDTTSQMWTMNPAHPDVFAYFRDYTDALLLEFGSEIDALVWDETFLVNGGDIATALPSYADRAMMKLVHDLTQRVTAANPQLALLASDDVGFFWNGEMAPYAIVAHGTYQDSESLPGVWRYGVFPNFRNTLWSCNWRPQTDFERTKFGVEEFNTPVASSNGYGDNIGIAALDATNKDLLFGLFAQRKMAGPQVLKWLTAP